MDDPRHQPSDEPIAEPIDERAEQHVDDSQSGTEPVDDNAFAPFPNWNTDPIKRPEPWSLRKKVLVFGGLGLAAVTLVASLAAFPRSEEDGSVDPNDGVGPVPTDTSSPAPTESQTPTNPEAFQGVGEVMRQTTTVEAMDNMEIIDYAKLSYADHLAYAIAKIPGLDVATPSNDYGTNPPSPFTTGTMVTGHYWSDIVINAISNADPQEGAKIMAAINYITYDVTNNRLIPGYQSMVDGVLETGGSGVGASTTWSATNNGEWQTGVDEHDKAIDYINVTFNTVKNEDDTVINTTTAQVVRVVVQTLDGKTVIGYPSYKTAPGQSIPVGTTY